VRRRPFGRRLTARNSGLGVEQLECEGGRAHVVQVVEDVDRHLFAASAALDLALSDNGRYLYVLAAGTHGIVTFSVGADGTLTHTDTEANVPGAAAGMAVR